MNEYSDDNLNENFLEENNNIQQKGGEEAIPLKKKIYAENIQEKIKLKTVLQSIESKLNEEINKKEEDQNDEAEEKKEEEKKRTKQILRAFKEQRKNKKYIWFLWAIFSIFLPFFTVINLTGIFQIISVMNALFEAFKRSITCYLDLEDKEDKSYYEFYNFYSFYFKESINEGIEFDLIETMGFLGTIFFKFYGFRISSAIFMLLNCISLFLIMNFFSQYSDTFEKYSLFQIIYLFFCNVLLFIGVGSSALLSQQILIDNYERYSSFLKEIDKMDNNIEQIKQNEQNEENTKEEEKQDTPYFILICVTSILGFLIKYILDVIISYEKNTFDQKYNITDIYDINNTISDNNVDVNEKISKIFSHDKILFIFIIIIYGGSILISIALYHCLRYVYEDEGVQQTQENDHSRNCQIFGYMFYLKKIKSNKNENINNLKKYFSQNILQNNPQEDKETVTQIVHGSEYKKQQEIKKEQSIGKRTLQWIQKFFLKICLIFKLFSDSLKSCVNEIVCNYFCCGKKNICCCCFCCECLECNCCKCCKCCDEYVKKVNDEDYEIKEEYFCYCYKSKRNLKWFNRFIRDDTQIRLIPLLLEYFLVQLSTIAFEVIFDENNEEGFNDYNDFLSILKFVIIFAFSLFLFFYLTISFGQIFIRLSEGNNNENPENQIDKIEKYTGKLSNKILNGTYGIIIFNGFYSFIVSLICLSKDVKNNYYFYIPILMNKFFFFTFAHHCTVFTDTEDGIDFFSCATLLSIYLEIWDFFLDLLKKCPINILLYFQLFLSSVIILASLGFLSIFLCFFGIFWFTFLYLLSFLFSFGGFWFFKGYEKCKCDEYEICKKHDLVCHNEDRIYKCFKGKENFEKFKSKLLHK